MVLQHAADALELVMLRSLAASRGQVDFSSSRILFGFLLRLAQGSDQSTEELRTPKLNPPRRVPFTLSESWGGVGVAC